MSWFITRCLWAKHDSEDGDGDSDHHNKAEIATEALAPNNNNKNDDDDDDDAPPPPPSPVPPWERDVTLVEPVPLPPVIPMSSIRNAKSAAGGGGGGWGPGEETIVSTDNDGDGDGDAQQQQEQEQRLRDLHSPEQRQQRADDEAREARERELILTDKPTATIFSRPSAEACGASIARALARNIRRHYMCTLKDGVGSKTAVDVVTSAICAMLKQERRILLLTDGRFGGTAAAKTTTTTEGFLAVQARVRAGVVPTKVVESDDAHTGLRLAGPMQPGMRCVVRADLNYDILHDFRPTVIMMVASEFAADANLLALLHLYHVQVTRTASAVPTAECVPNDALPPQFIFMAACGTDGTLVESVFPETFTTMPIQVGAAAAGGSSSS